MANTKMRAGCKIVEGSFSLDVFAVATEIGGGERALEYFKRYQSQRVSFVQKEEMKLRIKKHSLIKDYESGRYNEEELAYKYNINKYVVENLITRGLPSHVKDSVEHYFALVEIFGQKKADEFCARMEGCSGNLCRVKTLVRDERDRRIRELHKQGVPVSDLIRSFDLSSQCVNDILNCYKNRLWRKNRWKEIVRVFESVTGQKAYPTAKERKKVSTDN
jgi:Mor family transcriptional regulator